ncbi:MAG: GMP/IMP nucleotidase [Thiotrichales bacterium]
MLNWLDLRTVFLDMDGTLLDLHFDNHFWLEHVPRRYAEVHGTPHEETREHVFGLYQQVRGTLNWYCVDYWTRTLKLDIAGMKREVADRIHLLPFVQEFLDALLQHDVRVVLLTNAHPHSIQLKMAHTGLAHRFHRIISTHDLKLPKEAEGFWDILRQYEPFDPATTLLVDDNHSVLSNAARYGIAHLYGLAQPDTTRPAQELPGFVTLRDLRELLAEPPPR